MCLRLWNISGVIPSAQEAPNGASLYGTNFWGLWSFVIHSKVSPMWMRCHLGDRTDRLDRWIADIIGRPTFELAATEARLLNRRTTSYGRHARRRPSFL